MMDKSWLWDKKMQLKQLERILNNDANPRFIEFASLLLSRKNIPKEVFNAYLSPLTFCRNWIKIKKRMRQDNWNNPRIEFWQAIYEKLRDKYKSEKKDLFTKQKKGKVSNPLISDIAKIIAETRKKKGITQKQLAKYAGFSQQMISRIEQGRQNISMSTLRKIADSLGSNVEFNFVTRANNSALN